MQSADVWSGYIDYVGDDRKRFATWTGGVLGKVTRYETEERDRYTPSGGRYRMRHVTVRTPTARHGVGAAAPRWTRSRSGASHSRSPTNKGPKVFCDLLKI